MLIYSLIPELPIAAITVTDLNRQIRFFLENNIGEVSVLGEISNLTKASSGHWYFCLKDEKAQIRCVFFRNSQTLKTSSCEDGQQVIAKGRLSLYEARGEYQLIVQTLSAAGLGALYQLFEDLKKKLSLQGLFDSERKKPLPPFPQKIGIITSPTGAALQDIIITLGRRFPLATLFVYPSEVQGKNAASQLIKALQYAYQHNQAEVLILARGGGSFEDLWPFNDEQLAYTISQSPIPIVSGIGHETDITIADFVADKRAATPTAAAETVSPDQKELIALTKALTLRLHGLMSIKLQKAALQLAAYKARLISPQQLIRMRIQSIDHLEKQAMQALTRHLQQLKHRLMRQADLLKTLNPLATLERGYAIATQNDHVLLSPDEVNQDNLITIQLAKGKMDCRVINKETSYG